MAFSLPIQWEHGAGISVVATHVDSPNLKVHPVLNILDNAHFLGSSHFQAFDAGIHASWSRNVWRRHLALLAGP